MRAVEPVRRAEPGVGPEAGDDPGVGDGTDPGTGSAAGADPGTGEASGATPLVGRPSWLRIEIWRIRHCQRRKASRIRSLAWSSRRTFESDCIDPHRYAELRSPGLGSVSAEPDDGSIGRPNASFCQGSRGRIEVRGGPRRLDGNGDSASVFRHDHSREFAAPRSAPAVRWARSASPATAWRSAGRAAAPATAAPSSRSPPARRETSARTARRRGRPRTRRARRSSVRFERPGRRGGRRNRPRGPVKTFIPA